MKQPSFIRQVQQYFYLKKRGEETPYNTNIKFMHGMNRISIYLFLIALVIIIVRLFVRH